MPLFNQATNLQGRGNFAPGVTYYAGIKAPDQPHVHLPKQDAHFNIDLSRIGDAMIAAKEAEMKLGIAALESEQSMREAEKDRQLKLDLTKMQQEGEDRRLDKELSARWQIESMKNNTELLKMQKQREEKDKDYRLEQAEIALLGNEELQKAYIDYEADPANRSLEYQMTRNRIISDIARQYNVKVSNLQTVTSNAGLSHGVGSEIDVAIEAKKNFIKEQYDTDKTSAQMLNPGLYASNPEAAVAQLTGLRQRLAQINAWRDVANDSYETQNIKDWAQHQIDSDMRNVALDITLGTVEAAQNALGSRAIEGNPGAFIETMKQIATAEIGNATGLDSRQIRPVVDSVYYQSGLDYTVKDIFNTAEGNSKWVQTMLNYAKDSGQLDVMQNGSNYAKTALIIGQMPFFQSLDDSSKKMIANILSSEFFGRTAPYANESGERGWSYSYRGTTIKYSDQEIAELGKKLGMDVRHPDQIAAFAASQLIKGVESGVKNGTILDKDVVKITEGTYSAITGNKEPDLSSWNLNSDAQVQQQNNILHCAENGLCTDEDLMRGINVYSKGSPEYNRILELGRTFATETLLGKHFSSQSEQQNFYDAVEYASHPVNIKGEDVARFFGKNYKDDPDKWDHYNLKDTKVYYSEKDGKLQLKYYQNGWFKTGGTELGKKLNLISNTLAETGASIDQQKAWIENKFKGILVSHVDESVFNKASTTAQEYLADTAAMLDTKLLSELSSFIKDDKGLTEEELKKFDTEDFAFGAGFAQDDEYFDWTMKKLDEVGKEEYGLVKQFGIGLLSLLTYGAGTIIGAMTKPSEIVADYGTQAVLYINDWLKNTKGFELTPKQNKIIKDIANKIDKEQKSRGRSLTADEAWNMLFGDKGLNITVSAKPENIMSQEEYELNQSIDKELESLR